MLISQVFIPYLRSPTTFSLLLYGQFSLLFQHSVDNKKKKKQNVITKRELQISQINLKYGVFFPATSTSNE